MTMAAKGARRITIETLASGQPRPYADTRHHVRITLEHVPWNSDTGEFEPNFSSEEFVRKELSGMRVGFTEKTAKDADSQWFDTRLDWIKPINGKPMSEVIKGGDPKKMAASVWEFHTTSPFTD